MKNNDAMAIKHSSNSFHTGLFKVEVRASNAFSASDVDVDLEKILEACQNYSDFSADELGNMVCWMESNNNNLCTDETCFLDKMINMCVCACCWLSFYLQTDDTSDDSPNLKISAAPETVINSAHSVTLTVNGMESLPSEGLVFAWRCSKYNKSLTTDILIESNRTS